MVDQTGEDTDDRWALHASDRALLGDKTGTTRLGFAVVLKMFQAEGRDRPKSGGSGGSAERASCPALSDCIVSFEGAVRDRGSNPQHHVRSPWRPAHLLARAHPTMNQPLHGAFRRRRRYWLRVVTRRRVATNRAGHLRHDPPLHPVTRSVLPRSASYPPPFGRSRQYHLAIVRT